MFEIESADGARRVRELAHRSRYAAAEDHGDQERDHKDTEPDPAGEHKAIQLGTLAFAVQGVDPHVELLRAVAADNAIEIVGLVVAEIAVVAKQGGAGALQQCERLPVGSPQRRQIRIADFVQVG